MRFVLQCPGVIAVCGKEFDVPKMKTHSGAKKRFKKRSSGKIARKKAFSGHNLFRKSRKRKSDLLLPTHVHASDEDRVNRLLAS